MLSFLNTTVARHQVAQKELAAIQDEIQKKKQRVIRYAAQLRRSQEVRGCGPRLHAAWV